MIPTFRLSRLALALALTLLAALPARAIDIEAVTSPAGTTAWLVEDHSLPFVALELRFRGGTSLDAPGKRGAIHLMTALLEEGAGTRDAQAWAEEAERLAAEFDFDAGPDEVSVSARMLTETRDRAVDLLHDALVAPRFDADAIARVRAQVLSMIEADRRDPGALAGQTLRAALFGDHPYGSAPEGTADSVAALTRDDLLAARDRVLARDRVVIAAVGDITASDLGALIDRLLAGLPDTGAPLPPRAQMDTTGGVTVVPFGGPQSLVLMAQPGPKMDDPDFFPAYVANHILGGGGFSSRLMEEVREKRGLTYGIATYLAPRDLAETWQGSFASANEKVAEAIAVVRREWARLAEGGVSDAELTAAKTYLTGAYPLRFDGNGPIAAILAGMQTAGLPIDYVNTRNTRIEAVSAEDVARVARRWLDPERLRFVVVGQPEGVESTAP
ncbi:M16 family metallopeptidase [Phaeovulum vinaykumarii]|uniref:Zinc protease n=1 Tax=Phaeovulum vinaykumarii TaxID=407234 RepID=A0A1N7KYH9_9RHOB|nr:pitrilysin family protein [Phaeovulum vinaykumarii]SIS66679.1 zinc protease [Phaeovulum vinaykumarii]SOC01007.1 zinc protease [Phaeovulum vinaykumarii]